MLLLAAFLSWVVAFFGAGARGSEPRQFALWAATSALAVAFMRMQLPIAIALVAILLLVRPQASDARERILLFGALVIGLGCGSGAALVMSIAVIPYVLLVRWAMPKGSHRSADA